MLDVAMLVAFPWNIDDSLLTEVASLSRRLERDSSFRNTFCFERTTRAFPLEIYLIFLTFITIVFARSFVDVHRLLFQLYENLKSNRIIMMPLLVSTALVTRAEREEHNFIIDDSLKLDD